MTDIGAEAVTVWRDAHAHQRIDDLMTWKADHIEAHKKIDATFEAVTDISSTIEKISKRIKVWGPVIVTAAVSSGLASGKWGAFFSALFSGHP